MTFLTDLATNASKQNIGVVMYSGNNDGLIAHRGTEITIQVKFSYAIPQKMYSNNRIQNTTFGGTQGFSRKPATPWHDDSGNFAGIVHQERNWTYVLFDNVGHTVPADSPEHVSQQQTASPMVLKLSIRLSFSLESSSLETTKQVSLFPTRMVKSL